MWDYPLSLPSVSLHLSHRSERYGYELHFTEGNPEKASSSRGENFKTSQMVEASPENVEAMVSAAGDSSFQP
jgi:hypothetical protein